MNQHELSYLSSQTALKPPVATSRVRLMVVSFEWKARHVSPQSVPSFLLEGAIFSYRIEASEQIGTKSKAKGIIYIHHQGGLEFPWDYKTNSKLSFSFLTLVNLQLR